MLFGIKRQWTPHVSLGKETKVGGHDADDAVSLTIECELFADHISITTKAPLPEVVAQHNHMIRAGLILISGKRSAQLRIDAEH